MSTDGATQEPPTSPWSQVAAAVIMLTVVISAILTAFAWPAARSSVHDIPIAVAGPTASADQVVAALAQRSPNAFDITRVTDTAAAETAIENRDVYGAIDVTGGQPRVIVASAASPVISQALQALGTAVTQPESSAPVARDLAPLPSEDPRGAGLSAGSLPLVLGGMLAALLLSNRLRGAVQRLTGALVYSVTGGLAMAAILQFWLGSLEGDYWANAGVIALSVAATSFTILGLEALLGTIGFSLGAVLMMLLGNPLSGTTSAPEMLPGWSGQIGQFLPPGAAGWLLRSTAFFDGHAALQPVLVLTAWLIVGAALVVVGSGRRTRHAQRTAIASEPALA
jgi:hypothetical protein